MWLHCSDHKTCKRWKSSQNYDIVRYFIAMWLYGYRSYRLSRKG